MRYAKRLTADTCSEPDHQKICMVCGNHRHRVAFRKNNIDILECQICGMIFVHPSPTLVQQKQFYEKKHQEGTYHVCLSEKGERLKRLLSEYRWKYYVSPYLTIPAGRLLEIGCSAGYFLEVANSNGWETFGVEISTEAAREAQKIFGDNIVVGDFLELEKVYEDAFFDLVIMFDLIEHVQNPAAMLREVSRILRPKGLIVITTPNIDSIHAKLMGKYWSYLIPEEHLFYFRPHTIQRLLNAHNLSVVNINRVMKVLSLDYMTAIFGYLNPYFYKLFDPIVRLVPRWLREKTFELYVGEMLIIARQD